MGLSTGLRGHAGDMTQGSPLKLIMWFSVPLFVGNIFQQVYSIVDTIVAGHNLGSGAVAAIGATSSIYSLIIGFLSGLNSGYGIVIARAFGAHKRDELRQAVAAMLLLNGVLSILFTGVSLLGIRPLMRALNVPSDVFEQAYLYIAIILAGMLVTSLYNMCAGLLRAIGTSGSPGRRRDPAHRSAGPHADAFFHRPPWPPLPCGRCPGLRRPIRLHHNGRAGPALGGMGPAKPGGKRPLGDRPGV